MKKFLSIVAIAATTAMMTSCVVEEEKECEKNNTGEITIQNATGVELWFDVTGTDNLTNQNRKVLPGASTTYEMTSGTVNVWASHVNVNNHFKHVETKVVTECGTDTYTASFLPCYTLGTVNEVIVVNNTYLAAVVDISYMINGETYFGGELNVPVGYQATYYNVPAGEITSWFKYAGYTNWTTSTRTILSCNPTNNTFTWSPAKDGIEFHGEKTGITVNLHEKNNTIEISGPVKK